MFKFNGIYFRVVYGNSEFSRKRGSKTFLFNRRSSVVSAYPDENPIPEDSKPLAVGISFCSEKDNFSRRKGRKLALARCIKWLNWDEETTKKFWEAFLEKFGTVD